MTTSADTSKTVAVTARSPAWRDIDSAPKSEEVDLANPPTPIYLYWDGPKPWYTIGYWEPFSEKWECLGRIQPADFGRDPTHWQPVQPPRKYTLEHLLAETQQARDDLLDRYLENTQFLSSTTAMRDDPLFKELTEIGVPMGFLILDRMKEGQMHVSFFVLLREIFNESPVKPEHAGLVKLMHEDWLAWYESDEPI